MKKIFAIAAVAMMSATAFVSCSKGGALAELKAAVDAKDTAAVDSLLKVITADTTLTLTAEDSTLLEEAAKMVIVAPVVEETVVETPAAETPATEETAVEATDSI